MKISFEFLPFVPDEKEIIYVENPYDVECNAYCNKYIERYYDDMTRFANENGYRFVYLPLLNRAEEIRRKVEYYAPYLESEITPPTMLESTFILKYVDGKVDEALFPAFIIYSGTRLEFDVFPLLFFEGERQPIREVFRECIRSRTVTVRKDFRGARSGSHNSSPCIAPEKPRMSLTKKVLNCFMPKEDVRERTEELVCEMPAESFHLCRAEEPCEEQEDDIFVIMQQLDETVQKLRMKGITLMAIHEMIDKQEKLSRVVITPDYRIFLPDYKNMEIEMGVLPKALFFLFLRYPDGIRLKEMPDHYTELYNIYSQLKPNFKEARLRLTITELVNPLNNRMNENIARVRAAFLKMFDERLAQHYIIHGMKGETYAIDIDRSLIEWQE